MTDQRALLPFAMRVPSRRARRLEKPHSQGRALPDEHQQSARELDSCNSSGALLMNLFAYPGVLSDSKIAALVGHTPGAVPLFGADGSVPLRASGGDRRDTTKIDMLIGTVIVEAKLTESDFVTRDKAHVERYRDFKATFDAEMLPQTGGQYQGYQLIRNILCARSHDRSFTLCCDARRPDLVRQWWEVARAITEAPLRARCRLVFWQELAMAAPAPLQGFLAGRYGLCRYASDPLT